MKRQRIAAVWVVVGCLLGCEPATSPVPPATRLAPTPIPPSVVDEEAPKTPIKATDSSEPPTSASEKATVEGPDLQAVDLGKAVGYRATGWKDAQLFPWPAVPTGRQEFVGVPLDVSGAIFLWGKQNAERNMVYPESVAGIEIDRTFETLYVCHAAFFEAEPGEEIFHVVFHYENESAKSSPIVNVGDALDWFSKNEEDEKRTPTNERSTLAWTGEGEFSGRPQKIRFVMTALDNPRPSEKVVSVELVSAKKNTAGCVIGLSTGAKGAIKPMPIEPAVGE